MIKGELIKSASELKAPSADSVQEFEKYQLTLVSEMNDTMKSRKDIDQLIGEGNISMMEDNHHNHYRFLISLFNHYQAEVLVETVIWVFKTYRSHGFRLTYWPAQLNHWIDLYKKHFTKKTFTEIYPF